MRQRTNDKSKGNEGYYEAGHPEGPGLDIEIYKMAALDLLNEWTSCNGCGLIDEDQFLRAGLVLAL